MFVVEEHMPAPAQDAPSSVVSDICEYLTLAVVSECRDRFPEIAAMYTSEPQPEACGAATALVEAAMRKATMRLITQLNAKMMPGGEHLILIA